LIVAQIPKKDSTMSENVLETDFDVPESCIHPEDQRTPIEGGFRCAVCNTDVYEAAIETVSQPGLQTVSEETTAAEAIVTKVPSVDDLKNLDPDEMTVEELAPIVVEFGHAVRTAQDRAARPYIPFVLAFMAKTRDLPRNEKNQWITPQMGCYSLREFIRRHVKISPQAAYKELKKHAALQLGDGSKQPKQPKTPDAKDGEIAGLKQDLGEAAKMIKQLNQKLDPLEEENKKLKDKLAAQEAATTKQAHAAKDADKAASTIADELKAVKRELQQEKAKVTGHLKTIEKQQKEIERLQNKADNLTKNIEKKVQTIADLRAKLARKVLDQGYAPDEQGNPIVSHGENPFVMGTLIAEAQTSTADEGTPA
jgi:predicted  nucleic acid-binding Zn-ribbon protein